MKFPSRYLTYDTRRFFIRLRLGAGMHSVFRFIIWLRSRWSSRCAVYNSWYLTTFQRIFESLLCTDDLLSVSIFWVTWYFASMLTRSAASMFWVRSTKSFTDMSLYLALFRHRVKTFSNESRDGLEQRISLVFSYHNIHRSQSILIFLFFIGVIPGKFFIAETNIKLYKNLQSAIKNTNYTKFCC